MKLRHVLVPTLAAVTICAPTHASQPDGYALKLLSNPTVEGPGGEIGLPPVTCGGFSLLENFATTELVSTDTLTLDLAVVPFRDGYTQAWILGPGTGRDSCSFKALDFQDGLLNGLPYDRQGWNDVRVDVRVGSQDYFVTLNGAHAGPFPITQEFGGVCPSIAAILVTGSINGEETAWLDNMSLSTNAGSSMLVDSPFDFCPFGHWSTYVGGALVVQPPRNLRPKSKPTAAALPTTEPVRTAIQPVPLP